MTEIITSISSVENILEGEGIIHDVVTESVDVIAQGTESGDITVQVSEVTVIAETQDPVIITQTDTVEVIVEMEPGVPGVPGLIWLGAYSALVGYVVGDAVYYNGSSYICILASTGNLPTNATYWDVLALKGDDGDPAQGVPVGGSINYILAKASGDDYDTTWVPMPAGFSGEYGDLTGAPDLSVYVPYTGASGDVNIGVHSLIAHALQGDASDGVYIKANNGTNVGLLGVGNTANVTWYGAHIFSTMTQGSVLFTGANGLLSQDNQNFYFDDTDNILFVSGTLGSEIVTNGGFASGTGWTAPSGWTISGGVATHGTNGTGALAPSTAVTIYAGLEYLVSVDIGSWTAGTGTITVGGVTIAVASASGTYTKKIIATATTNLAITPSNTARFTVDNVSIKQLTGGGISSGNFYGGVYYSTVTGLGITAGDGMVLDNPTPATGSVLQSSPALRLRGRGWLTNSSSSFAVDFRQSVIGIAGLTAYGKWRMEASPNGGAYSEVLSYSIDNVGQGFAITPIQALSNGGPGTTRHMTLNNTGSNTWTDYRFSGTLRVATGASSSGEYSIHSTGGNYFGLYYGSPGLGSSTLYCYIYPSALVHSQGHISAQYGMNAGSSSNTVPPSKMTVHGRMGLKPTYIYTNTTLDDTYSLIYANGDLNNICTGTPTYACSHWTNESDCNLRNFHGGNCSWFAGSSCSVYDYELGMANCSGTSGCTVVTSACSGGDQMTCEANDDAYGGNCAWTETTADCSAFNGDEATCGSTSGCTQNYGDCTPYSDGGGDGSACSGYNAGCSYDSGTGACTGSPYLSCSGTYSLGFSCTGNYNTGSCTGTYGANCSGTSACTGVDYADCLSEAGCTQSSGLSLTFPTEGSYSTGFYAGYEVINVGTTANVTMLPNTGQTANGTTSITIGPNRKARIMKFAWVQNTCQAFSGTSSGECTTGHTGCTWTSCSGLDEATCISEGGSCSWDGVSCVGAGNCSGTWGVRDWGITGGVF